MKMCLEGDVFGPQSFNEGLSLWAGDAEENGHSCKPVLE
jgi:hypothetical protein